MKTKLRSASFLMFFSVLLLLLGGSTLQAQDEVEVISADPPSAPQGTINLEVVITGNGFKKGDHPVFLVPGTGDPDVPGSGDPGGVTVNSSKVRGPTKMIANIDIEVEALAGSRDIEILSRSNGRRGKGTELFSVTKKEGGGSGAQCDLSNPTPQNLNDFTLVSTLELELEKPVREFSKFGNNLAGRQVFLKLNNKEDPILFAVTENTGSELGGGPGQINLYLLKPDDGTVSQLVDRYGPVILPTELKTGELIIADLDGNKAPDFISARASLVEVFVGEFDDSADGTLTYQKFTITALTDLLKCGEPTSVPVSGFGSSVAAGDIDGGDNDGGDVYDEIAIGARGGGSGKNATSGKILLFDFDQVNGKFSCVDVVDSAEFGLSTQAGFGRSVAFGDVDGDATLDLIVGAPQVKNEKSRDAGEVFVFVGTGGSFASSPITLIKGSKNDLLGTRLATLPVGPPGHDVVVVSQWQSNPSKALHFPFQWPVEGVAAAPDFTLISGEENGGWATSPLGIADIDGDGSPDYLIGAPNTSCGGNGSLGLAYLYLSSGPNPGPSPSLISPTATFLPPTYDPDWNAFGWSTLAISADSGESFVIIGEPGRNIDGIDFVGRVYIYKYKPPPQ